MFHLLGIFILLLWKHYRDVVTHRARLFKDQPTGQQFPPPCCAGVEEKTQTRDTQDKQHCLWDARTTTEQEKARHWDAPKYNSPICLQNRIVS